MKRHLLRTFAVTAALIFSAGIAAAGQAEDISADAVQERIEAGTAPLILDVRTVEEFAAGHLPGAMNIPHDELGDRLSELDIALGDEVIVYCRSGRRAGVAEELLGGAGYTKVMDLEGHWLEWSAAGRPSETE
jgi:rhodanese-related sulfurtransferase